MAGPCGVHAHALDEPGGADWLPSGSVELLEEMQVARCIVAAQGEVIEPRELVEMVTSCAAGIPNLPRFLGRLASGRPADVLVLERQHDDPYESVCRSTRASVELVTIDGRLVYGRDDWFGKLAPQAAVFARNAATLAQFGNRRLS